MLDLNPMLSALPPEPHGEVWRGVVEENEREAAIRELAEAASAVEGEAFLMDVHGRLRSHGRLTRAVIAYRGLHREELKAGRGE